MESAGSRLDVKVSRRRLDIKEAIHHALALVNLRLLPRRLLRPIAPHCRRSLDSTDYCVVQIA